MLTTYFKRQTTRTIYYGGPAGPHLGEDAHNLTLPMAGCFASDSNDAGEGWLPAVARGNLDQKAMDTLDAGVSILSGDDSGLLRGLFALKSVSLSQARSDVTGILEVAELPPQSTFWRFLASLDGGHLI